MGEIIKAYIVPHPPIIVPEIGKGQEKDALKTITAYEQVGRKVGELAPDVIIIITPHGLAYSNFVRISPGEILDGSFKDFSAPNLKFEFNNETGLIQKIIENAHSCGIDAGMAGSGKNELDHGSLVPLYYIAKYYKNFSVIRISIAGLSLENLYVFGNCIQKSVNQYDKRIVLIGSGDLSHRLKADGPYGFAQEGPIFDSLLVQAVKAADFKKLLEIDENIREAAGECGLRAFAILFGALNGYCIKSDVISYEGPYGVGYMVAEISVDGQDLSRDLMSYYECKRNSEIEATRKAEDPYVRLARETLENYVRKGKVIEIPDYLPEEMLKRKAGVFVSIKKHGQLRGCIGTISPVTNSIAEEIIQNAISSGTRDPRFNPVKDFELKDLVYSVDVLGEPEKINSIEDLDVSRYGVIVTSGYRRGLLLPDLEGVETPEQQIAIARAKAGISENDNYIIERFEVIRHK
jgi:AmmeMemoRadiSam system protein A